MSPFPHFLKGIPAEVHPAVTLLRLGSIAEDQLETGGGVIALNSICARLLTFTFVPRNLGQTTSRIGLPGNSR